MNWLGPAVAATIPKENKIPWTKTLTRRKVIKNATKVQRQEASFCG